MILIDIDINGHIVCLPLSNRGILLGVFITAEVILFKHATLHSAPKALPHHFPIVVSAPNLSMYVCRSEQSSWKRIHGSKADAVARNV